MITIPFLRRRTERTPCTIEIEHTERSLHAHVALDASTPLQPGDRVRVDGAPVRIAFGDVFTLRREATVERAGWLERQWTRLVARLELSALYEVSFTPGRLP
jgi:uncharacterized Zn finger protein